MDFLQSLENVPNSALILSSMVSICIIPLLPQNIINLLDHSFIRNIVLVTIALLTFFDFRLAIIVTVVYFIAINTKSRETYEDSLKIKKRFSVDITFSDTEDDPVTEGEIKDEDIIREQDEITEDTQTLAPPEQTIDTFTSPTSTTSPFSTNPYYL